MSRESRPVNNKWGSIYEGGQTKRGLGYKWESEDEFVISDEGKGS